MKPEKQQLSPLASDSESRRDFLKTAGKLAVYTPPAMMMLMQPSRRALAGDSILPGNFWPNNPNHNETGNWPESDWKNTDPMKVDLAEIDQKKIDMAKVDLKKIDWAKVDLKKIDWAKVDLKNVDWDRINWKSLDPGNMNINLQNINLQKIDWKKVDWQSVDWQSVDWQSVDWQSVDWQKVDWQKVDWQKIKIDQDLPGKVLQFLSQYSVP